MSECRFCRGELNNKWGDNRHGDPAYCRDALVDLLRQAEEERDEANAEADALRQALADAIASDDYAALRGFGSLDEEWKQDMVEEFDLKP